MRMRLGILLATSPERQDVSTVVKLAQAALAQGHEVSLYVMDDGVYALRDHPKNPWATEFKTLLGQGAKVALCALNCSSRGLAKEEVVPGVLWGSQYDHAAIVNESDRYLAFS